jgi:hypothetical protein
VMGLWLLNHPDVRGNARVRALSGFLAQAVPAEIARLQTTGAVCKTLATCPLLRQQQRQQQRQHQRKQQSSSASL